MNNDTMLALAQIFVNNPIDTKLHDAKFEPFQKPRSYEVRIAWFNRILEAMKQLGYTDYEFFRPESGSSEASPNKTEVSINNYCIVEFQSVISRTLLELYGQEKDWSHPAVLMLMKAVVSGEMKTYLHSRVLWNVWSPMKLFVNMVGGAVRSRQFDLRIRGGVSSILLERTADKIVENTTMQLAKQDQVVCFYHNHLFLQADPRTIKAKIDSQGIPFVYWVGEDIQALNKAARAYKIDIVK